jgi:hypothetical protein
MLTALLATPAGLHNCQTCWVHSVRLHDPGQCQPSQSQWGEEKWLLEHFFAEKRNGGISSQGQPPTGNLSGTTSYQGLGEADMPLDALLQSYFA